MQPARFVIRDESLHHGDVEGVESRRGAEGRYGVAVLQLDELHEPLDIAERAPSELQVPGRIGAPGKPLGLDPGLDALDLTHIIVRDLGGEADLVRQ